MLIVSQDKYNILNFDTTVNIGVEEISTLNDIVQISAQTNGNTIILGKYKTEERAKEVLQAIINLSSLSPNQSNVNINDIIGYYMVKKLTYYEMPKE